LGIGPSIGATLNWLITLIPAVLCLTYNVFAWGWDAKAQDKAGRKPNIELVIPESPTESPVKSAPKADMFATVVPPAEATSVYIHTISPSKSTQEPPQITSSKSAEDLEFLANETTALEVKESQKEKDSNQETGPSPFDDTSMPTTKQSLANLPWAVLPFLFGMFTLVQALNKAGWIDEFAQGVVSAIPQHEGDSPRAIAIAAFLMTTVSFVLCNLINNQPASILLTRVVIAPLFESLPPKVKSAGMYGVIEGANVGANWTIIGALAGILWATILRNKGIVVQYFEFMKVGVLIMPLVTFVVALVIFLEHL